MKKVFFALSLILISLSSCKKDDADSTVYTQSMLNGTWENVVKTNGVADQIAFTSTGMSIGANGLMVNCSKYSFDGKKITYCPIAGMEALATDELTINELTSTKLVVTSKLAEEKNEYKKIK